MRVNSAEKMRQEKCPWARSKYFEGYNSILGYFKVKSCLDYARGTSLLDLACGDGLMTQMFADHFDRIVGVDASGKHLAVARQRVPGAKFCEGLIEEFETGERFDNVYMLDVLEHVRDPIFVLQKAASFLKDEGILIVHVPNANAINRRIAVFMGTLKTCDELSPFDIEIAGHRRSYTMETLKRDIEKAGLNIVDTGGVFFKMLSTPQMDWFLKNGLWEEGGFGWGRVGADKKNWKAEFCRACYEIGKERPEDCNIIYAIIKR